MLKVEKVSLLANIVDEGRTGMQGQGYSQSGALDWLKFYYANALLGQTLWSPAIEVLGGNFCCRFTQACVICITGADAKLSIDGLSISLGCPVLISIGQQLSIKQLNKGLVNYIAVKAALISPSFGNSVCAVAREKRGGIRENGSSLQKGDFINGTPYGVGEINKALIFNETDHRLPNALRHIFSQYYAQTKVINISLSYQAHFFTHQQISQFTHKSYQVTNNMDRMGMRLHGKSIFCTKKVLSSQGMVYGAVQIPGDGQPIIMRNDRQTIGGYPIIGVVDRLSMAILGQTVPGESIEFSIADFEESRQKRLLVCLALEKLLARQAQLFTHYA